jgi:hypothetical protein
MVIASSVGKKNYSESGKWEIICGAIALYPFNVLSITIVNVKK